MSSPAPCPGSPEGVSGTGGRVVGSGALPRGINPGAPVANWGESKRGNEFALIVRHTFIYLYIPYLVRCDWALTVANFNHLTHHGSGAIAEHLVT